MAIFACYLETWRWPLEEIVVCVYVLITRSCPTLCESMDCSLRLLCPQNSPGKNTGVGSHALLQGIFLTQVSCFAGRFFTVWATTEAQNKQLQRVKIGCLWETRLRVRRGRIQILFIIKSYSASFVFLVSSFLFSFQNNEHVIFSSKILSDIIILE